VVTVVNTNDSGAGSLRQAMLDVNATPELNTIAFNIAGPGPHTIALESELPVMSSAVTIDATSNPGYVAGTPVVEINGTSVTLTGTSCIDLEASYSFVSGLIINRYPGNALVVNADNCGVYGCWIGVNNTGTGGAGNAATSCGITVFGAFNQIGAANDQQRNVICLGQDGIRIQGADALFNTIQGNWIGILPDASVADFGPAFTGIYLLGGASFNDVGSNLGGGNVIGGCNFAGIAISTLSSDPNPSNSNRIYGNRVGTNPSATAAIPNADGVAIFNSQYNEVGSSYYPGSGNLIAAIPTGRSGVGLTGADCYSNTVNGNTVGVDATGNGALGANYIGVALTQNAHENYITDNVISNNQFGVVLTSGAWSNTIYGNAIGVGADRITPLGNIAAGIVTADAATTGNVVGWPQVERQNIISNNGIGVVLSPPNSANQLTLNKIYGNTNLGIDRSDLITFGITSNDSADVDGIQNYPVITSASVADSDHITVSGTINTLPNTLVWLEFFANSLPDPSGAGEGEKLCIGPVDMDNFVTHNTVTTDEFGNASFTFTLGIDAASASDSISATATTNALGTSEFSTIVMAPVNVSQFSLE
jgi:parallel beta-helix repeat protein